MNKNIYGVGQVNAYIHRMFDEDFMLRDIRIKGEVSNCKYHSSGHIYFTLKDADGAISAIMFRGSRVKGLRFPMKDGDQVVVQGSITVYDKGGTYQIYAKEITLDGAGDLYVRFEQLKKELEEMGMFAAVYKKPIPRFAQRIGIVTAPTGAAVRDIIQISKRRNPHVQLILYPALVQGEGAAESIVSGILALDAMHLDVIIVGRGGGSIEDLWAFNEEIVARAVFSCETPVISAVGHETDTTICDYVADLRAPTPSAAAEQAVFSYTETQEMLEYKTRRLQQYMQMHVQTSRQRLQALEKQLTLLSPLGRLQEKRQYSMHLEERMQQDMQRILQRYQNNLAIMSERLDGMSPLKKLAQGYAYASDMTGRCVSSIEEHGPGDLMQVYVRDGMFLTEIKEINEDVAWKKKN